MNIKFYPNLQYIQSFSSKKPEIKKADDIQRKTRTAFPFFSPSYADDYYPSCSLMYKAPSDKKAVEHWDNLHRLDRMAARMVDIRRNRWENLRGRDNFTSKFLETYLDIKKYGLANCEEAATTTLASLLANGYKNSFKCSLRLNTGIYEKGSKDPKFVVKDLIDHACVISTMDKNPKNKSEYYVLDSWCGFADSIHGAKARYKQLIDVKKFEKSKQKTINKFINQYKDKYKNFDINNFEVRQHIGFDIKEMADDLDNEAVKLLYKEMFPSLISE
ncbi:hypothetical protein IKQ26_06000 [bacterium]|nr:hypothetical protein [bacterium]